MAQETFSGEWQTEEAVEMIQSILMDEISEDNLSEDDCLAIAKKIVKHLEKGGYP